MISCTGLAPHSPWPLLRLRSWMRSTGGPPARGFVAVRAWLRQGFITKIVSILLPSY